MPALTGIRAVASVMVYIHHFNPFSERLVGKRLHYFTDELHIGLPIFFVLSGLLICLRYYDNLGDRRISFYNYMVKRVGKIYPVLFLFMTLNFIFYMQTDYFEKTQYHNGWIYYIGGLTFLKGFFSGPATVFVGQGWSLTVEECFYFSAPFFFLLINKYKNALVLIPLFLVSFGCLLVFIFTHHPFYGFFGDFHFLFNHNFFGRCIEFFIGIALALAYKKYKPKATASSKGWFTYIGIFNIIVCVWLISLFHTRTEYGDAHPLGIAVNNLLLPAAGIAVLFWGLLTERTWVRSFLSIPVVELLGRSSYVFYLIHLGFFSNLLYAYVKGNLIPHFIILNLLSVVLYKVYEHPLNVWINNTFTKKQKPAIAAAS
jgi:peptidoglycan/LPS O-acetylase OafA/YrhL